MTFSDKIKVSRELCNLTQQQLADKVGVSKRTIASYESTDARARSSTMRKLAMALGASYDYLANDEITDPQQGIEKTLKQPDSSSVTKPQMKWMSFWSAMLLSSLVAN